MNELSRHIEALLLDNDCVVVPGLGGFVAHHTPARWMAEDSLFLPPARVVGFNPQLKMNDGLLAQSYATVYQTSFARASQLIAHEVDELKDQLRRQGKAELDNVGELRCSIDDAYSFTPYDNRLATPALYGLDSFRLTPIHDPMTQTSPDSQAPTSSSTPTPTDAPRKDEKPNKVVKFNPQWIVRVAAVAAAVVVFFALSTPLLSPPTEEMNGASLLPLDWADGSLAPLPEANGPTTKGEAMANEGEKPGVESKEEVVAEPEKPTSGEQEADPKPASSAPAPSAKVAERVTVAPSTVGKPTATPSLRYHVIVASVGSEADANEAVARLRAQGHDNAHAVIGDGRNRVAIDAYETEAAAHQAVAQLRTQAEYAGAWVLKK